MPAPPFTEPLHVVIVGGGIAALEAVLALHDLAGERVHVTLIAPEPNFVLRPLAVAAPFARGHVDRLPLAQVMAEHDGSFVRGSALHVDAAARTIALTTGQEIAYDALVIAHGASAIPAFSHAETFGAAPLTLNGILADLEEGYSRSVAFVVPAGNTWPLPLYELALMSADEVWSMNMDRVAMHLVTPESAPLELFGPEASEEVSALLAAAGITVHLGVSARIERQGHVQLADGKELVVNRVVALPLLVGRPLDGLPANSDSFIPVDDAGSVAGLDAIYAVGDTTDRPVKQGGLSCQQADVAAAHIAARAGADIEVPPLQQVLRGRLLTGGCDRFLRRACASEAAGATQEPLWWPPMKVSGKYLSPYLTAKGIVHLPPHSDPRRAARIDVHVAVKTQRRCVPGGVTNFAPSHATTPRESAPPTASDLSIRA